MASTTNRLFRLKLSSLIFGSPLETNQAEQHRVGVLGSIPVFGSSIISSQGYAADEMLYVLSGLGAIGFAAMNKVSLGVTLLLVSILLVYRKAIQKYPHGGGSYTIAQQHLGQNYGLLAGAGLTLDYILTVAVSVSSAVENMTGMVPWFATSSHKVFTICAIIIFMTVVNLRGLRESAALFALPVYLYLVSVFALIAVGLFKVLILGVDTAAGAAPITTAGNGLTAFLLLKALAGGTTALTGIEAVSNGVTAYKAPSQKRAIISLYVLGAIAASGLGGMAYLASKFHTVPEPHNTVMNQLGIIVYGQSSPLYYVLMACAAIILVIAANTSFAGLPILLNLMARDSYMPRYFKNLGDRLVYSKGILLVSFVSILLVLIFHGDTHSMIPLYAIGVLIGFALTGFGLAKHTLHIKGKNWLSDLLIFSFGGLVSFTVFLVFLITKFREGAWVIVILIPILMLLFRGVHKIYSTEKSFIHPTREDIDAFSKRIAEINHRRQGHSLSEYRSKIIIPVFDINRVVLKALLYAFELTPLVTAVHVASDMERAEKLRKHWQDSGIGIELEILESPYRAVVNDLMAYLDRVDSNPDLTSVTIAIPEYVPNNFWQNLLHNQTGQLLKLMLLLRRNIYVTSIPYHPPAEK